MMGDRQKNRQIHPNSKMAKNPRVRSYPSVSDNRSNQLYYLDDPRKKQPKAAILTRLVAKRLTKATRG